MRAGVVWSLPLAAMLVLSLLGLWATRPGHDVCLASIASAAAADDLFTPRASPREVPEIRCP